MGWEATALDLLESVGIRTPLRTLTKVGDRSVLLLQRFDRAGDERIGYMSAMTAVGASDGEHSDYADIALAVRDLSLSPKADLRELFHRVVASVALGNTDDHLLNHGLLANRGAWTLSPAFDVNPQPDSRRPRATSIMGADTPPDEAEALLPFADECGLNPAFARERISFLVQALSGWRERARMNGLANREIALMAESIEPRMTEVARIAAPR